MKTKKIWRIHRIEQSEAEIRDEKDISKRKKLIEELQLMKDSMPYIENMEKMIDRLSS